MSDSSMNHISPSQPMIEDMAVVARQAVGKETETQVIQSVELNI